jgi:hypothetical protein
MAIRDLTGQTFGRLEVVRLSDQMSKEGCHIWICKCSCGGEKPVPSYLLVRGTTKSCGCLQRERGTALGSTWRRHGLSRSLEYHSWRNMINRCCNEKSKDYPRYGGRGIKVCDRWRDSFENFLADMGPRPSPTHTLDRHPNNNGDYKPGNTRWATPTQQGRNKRNNLVLEFNGQSKVLAEWAELLGMKPVTLGSRLSKGWSVEKSLTTPPGPPRTRLTVE